MANTATLKKSIKPVTFTVTIEARKVNENGTFSSFEVKSVKGPNSTAKVVSPPQAGGAIYLKVSSLENIQVQDEAVAVEVAKTKLF